MTVATKKRPAWLRLLKKHGACDDGYEWAKNYATMQLAWDACEDASWMLWLIAKIDGTYSPRLRLAACACARTALKYVPKGEDRPRIAIETAERYARGDTTAEELETARRNAAYAAAAAYDAAAYAAAYADAADAAYAAAADAAAADAADAARKKMLAKMAKLVREIIPNPGG